MTLEKPRITAKIAGRPLHPLLRPFAIGYFLAVCACDLIYSALEAGINSYRLETADPVLAEVLGQALKHVDRKLVQVSLTLGAGDGRRGSDRDFSAEGITSAIDKALQASGPPAMSRAPRLSVRAETACPATPKGR